MGWGLSKLETKNNQESELPKDDSIVVTNERLESIFGEKDLILIGIESDNIFTIPTIQKIADISEELKNVDGVIVDEITSLSTINNIQGQDWGLEVGALMKTVPTDENELAQIKQQLKSNKLINGRIISKDGTFTAIIANVENYDQGTVFDQVNAIVEKYSGPEKFYLAGSPIQQQEVDKGIQEDVGFLLPLALVLVLIGFYLSFRTLRGVVLPFIVVLLSIVWTMGTMGHLGYYITVVTSAIPMLMIAISSSYGIHLLHRYYEEVEDKDQVTATRVATEKTIPAIAMTGITSAIGLGSLLIFKVTSIQEFGIITALGMISTVIITITAVPAILSLSKRTTKTKKEVSTGGSFDKMLTKLAIFSVQRKSWVFVLTLLIFAISVIGIFQVRVGIDFVKYFPNDHRLRLAFEKFNEKLGGSRTLDIMIAGKETDAIKDPDLLQKIADFQKFAETLPGVGYTSSFVDIISRINQEMNEGDSAYDRIPESQNLVAQYLLLYSMSGDPGDFNELVDFNYQRAKIRFMLSTSEQDDHMHIYQSLKNYAAAHFNADTEIEFGGEVMFWLAQIKYIITGKIQNIILAIIFVCIFCMVIFRTISGGLLSIVPLLVSSLLTFGLMGFLGIRLETGTAIITATGIGIGVDFAIHYLLRFREEIASVGSIEEAAINTNLTSGKAIIYDVISNVMGFIVFIFSGFLPIRYFGWLVSLTMLTVCFGTFLILPALFAFFKPRFISKNVTKAPGSNTFSEKKRQKIHI